MKKQRQHFLFSYLKTLSVGFNPRPSLRYSTQPTKPTGRLLQDPLQPSWLSWNKANKTTTTTTTKQTTTQTEQTNKQRQNSSLWRQIFHFLLATKGGFQSLPFHDIYRALCCLSVSLATPDINLKVFLAAVRIILCLIR